MISGNAGVAGATLTYAGGSTTADTTTGDYSFTVPFGWSGTVTPVKNCYTFSPLSVSYSAVTADWPAQNYAAEPMACADVNVFIGSLNAGSYGVPSGSQAHPIYPGVFDGAVERGERRGRTSW